MELGWQCAINEGVSLNHQHPRIKLKKELFHTLFGKFFGEGRECSSSFHPSISVAEVRLWKELFLPEHCCSELSCHGATWRGGLRKLGQQSPSWATPSRHPSPRAKHTGKVATLEWTPWCWSHRQNFFLAVWSKAVPSASCLNSWPTKPVCPMKWLLCATKLGSNLYLNYRQPKHTLSKEQLLLNSHWLFPPVKRALGWVK